MAVTGRIRVLLNAEVNTKIQLVLEVEQANGLRRKSNSYTGV